MDRTIPYTQLKKQEIALLLLEKIAFKIEAIIRDKEEYAIMIKDHFNRQKCMCI